MRFNCPFILASGSPRRKQLLQKLGLEFEVLVSEVDESFEAGRRPSNVAEDISARKAKAISPMRPEAITLAADTIVLLDGNILGKPTDADDAVRMLQKLSNKVHTVLTGLTLAHPASGRQFTSHEETSVFFADMTQGEIEGYVATGSPMDKAGAYGIQDDHGALFVARLEGDYYNVVGLPLFKMYTMLKEHFSDLLVM